MTPEEYARIAQGQAQAQAQPAPQMPSAVQAARDLMEQRAQHDQQYPTYKGGLLSGDQKGVLDIFSNPDQAQVNAGLGALFGVLNPKNGQPGLTALSQGLGAFGDQRGLEYKSAVARHEAGTESLKDRLAGVLDINKADLNERKYNREGLKLSNTTAGIGGTIGTDAEGNRVFRANPEGQPTLQEEIEVYKRGGLTQFNVTSPTGDGKGVSTYAVQRNTQGQFFDIQGNPIQLPIGSRLSSTGKTDVDAATGGLTTPQVGKTQESIMRNQRKMRTLQKITTNNLNKYLTTKGRGISTIGTILDYAQGLGGAGLANLSETLTGVDPIEFAAQSRVVFEDLEGFFNEHKKDVTGAAAALDEIKQIRKSVLSKELPPAQAIASMASLISKIDANLEAEFMALENGVQRTPAESRFIIQEVK
tara:strand:+ start:10164 stop:11417 length:1254 start_codon:yes stop_codon:yes gene_type:complete